MSPHDRAVILHGDALDLLRQIPDGYADSVVTDPPYALEFMGRAWDRFDSGDAPGSFQHWCQLWAAECLRILKPGGHLLAFGGSRTWHRLAAGIEDAGFEIRDSIAWMYGSGFPKSLDVSKAIDKAAGVEREVVGERKKLQSYGQGVNEVYGGGPDKAGVQQITAPATPDAERWQGWGTALKPAFEPIVVARKPLQGTVAANVLTHGTGALNIDASRIGAGQDYYDKTASVVGLSSGHGYSNLGGLPRTDSGSPAGRWPANVVLDESQAAALDEQSGYQRDGTAVKRNTLGRGKGGGAGRATDIGEGMVTQGEDQTYGSGGGASRFFYVAKAPKSERPVVDGVAHPTVKPLALMRWLVKLVTPPAGIVLEPFAGSGTTVEAALQEGFFVVGIEREAEYLPLIEARIARVAAAED